MSANAFNSPKEIACFQYDVRASCVSAYVEVRVCIRRDWVSVYVCVAHMLACLCAKLARNHFFLQAVARQNSSLPDLRDQFCHACPEEPDEKNAALGFQSVENSARWRTSTCNGQGPVLCHQIQDGAAKATGSVWAVLCPVLAGAFRLPAGGAWCPGKYFILSQLHFFTHT